MGEVRPLSSLESEQKVESIRFAVLWQRGHEAPSLDWLNERNNSNFCSQLGQKYSYIGIFPHR